MNPTAGAPTERDLIQAAVTSKAARQQLRTLMRQSVEVIAALYVEHRAGGCSPRTMIDAGMRQFNAALNAYAEKQNHRKRPAYSFERYFTWLVIRRIEQLARDVSN